MSTLYKLESISKGSINSYLELKESEPCPIYRYAIRKRLANNVNHGELAIINHKFMI